MARLMTMGQVKQDIAIEQVAQNFCGISDPTTPLCPQSQCPDPSDLTTSECCPASVLLLASMSKVAVEVCQAEKAATAIAWLLATY